MKVLAVIVREEDMPERCIDCMYDMGDFYTCRITGESRPQAPFKEWEGKLDSCLLRTAAQYEREVKNA